jgi:hypothetical protein
MTDEELTRRLEATLRAKAAQVPEPTGAFEPTTQLTELGTGSAKPSRGAWRYALVSAALIALVVGVTTVVVLAAGSDDSSRPAAPGPSTTTAAPTTVAPSTTTAPTTTVPTATTTTPPTPVTSRPLPPPAWTEFPQPSLPSGTVPVAGFNAYLDRYPSAAADPRPLALTFTHNDPPPTEPANALRVEDQALSSGRQQVIVFTRLADDSVAEVRYDLVFMPHSDGTWRLASASWSQRCQPNRGHQDFTTEVCI